MAVAPSRPSQRARPQRAELEHALLQRYHRDGDLAAREELVARLLPFARSLAARYSYTSESLDDLTQVASLALLKAIDRFDPDRGVRFTSFAAPTILGELKRHFRDAGWAVHVSRGLQELSLVIAQKRETLAKELGRSPNIRELAQAAGCSVENAIEASQVTASAHEARSLDVPVTTEDGEGATLGERLGAEDAAYELVETRETIAHVWGGLSELERRVVALRLGEGMTQSEIADRIGYSQMHVSRLLSRVMDRVHGEAAAA
ncbi:MAG: sigma-70 family RNA polymerase sigma factor [Thermoleophilaceae bacterium]|nr:sigma-70 family RNA polymerase sigma factor [Thermoleophilaceae bacterium]